MYFNYNFFRFNKFFFVYFFFLIGCFLFLVYELFLYIFLYVHFSSPLIFLAPSLVEELFKYPLVFQMMDNDCFLSDMGLVSCSSHDILVLNLFELDHFFVDFYTSSFTDSISVKHVFNFFNTFIFSPFIDLPYEQPFLFRDIPVKDFNFKDFDFKEYDFVYKKNRPADFFFSCWYIDSYFDFFNVALYTDYTNSLMHSFVEDDGLKEVLRLNIYNKFKLNSDNLDVFFNFDRSFFLEELLFLEKIDSFESFTAVYDAHFLDIVDFLKDFNSSFNEVILNVGSFPFEFYFFDLQKNNKFFDLLSLYNKGLLLYDKLAFLYSYDIFFYEIFDICATLNAQSLFFFDRLGHFIFFLENFLFNLSFFISVENLFSFPEFFSFIHENFSFYSENFLFLLDDFNNLKLFLDFQCFSFFFGDFNFFSLDSFNSFFSLKFIDNFWYDFSFGFFSLFFDYFFSFFFSNVDDYWSPFFSFSPENFFFFNKQEEQEYVSVDNLILDKISLHGVKEKKKIGFSADFYSHLDEFVDEEDFFFEEDSLLKSRMTFDFNVYEKFLLSINQFITSIIIDLDKTPENFFFSPEKILLVTLFDEVNKFFLPEPLADFSEDLSLFSMPGASDSFLFPMTEYTNDDDVNLSLSPSNALGFVAELTASNTPSATLSFMLEILSKEPDFNNLFSFLTEDDKASFFEQFFTNLFTNLFTYEKPSSVILDLNFCDNFSIDFDFINDFSVILCNDEAFSKDFFFNLSDDFINKFFNIDAFYKQLLLCDYDSNIEFFHSIDYDLKNLFKGVNFDSILAKKKQAELSILEKIKQIDLDIQQNDLDIQQNDLDIQKFNRDLAQIELDIQQINRDISQIDFGSILAKEKQEALSILEKIKQIDLDIQQIDLDNPQINRDIKQIELDIKQIELDNPQFNRDLMQIELDIKQIERDIKQIELDIKQINRDITPVETDMGQIVKRDIPQIEREIKQVSLTLSKAKNISAKIMPIISRFEKDFDQKFNVFLAQAELLFNALSSLPAFKESFFNDVLAGQEIFSKVFYDSTIILSGLVSSGNSVKNSQFFWQNFFNDNFFNIRHQKLFKLSKSSDLFLFTKIEKIKKFFNQLVLFQKEHLSEVVSLKIGVINPMTYNFLKRDLSLYYMINSLVNQDLLFSLENFRSNFFHLYSNFPHYVDAAFFMANIYDQYAEKIEKPTSITLKKIHSFFFNELSPIVDKFIKAFLDVKSVNFDELFNLYSKNPSDSSDYIFLKNFFDKFDPFFLYTKFRSYGDMLFKVSLFLQEMQRASRSPFLSDIFNFFSSFISDASVFESIFVEKLNFSAKIIQILFNLNNFFSYLNLEAFNKYDSEKLAEATKQVTSFFNLLDELYSKKSKLNHIKDDIIYDSITLFDNFNIVCLRSPYNVFIKKYNFSPDFFLKAFEAFFSQINKFNAVLVNKRDFILELNKFFELKNPLFIFNKMISLCTADIKQLHQPYNVIYAFLRQNANQTLLAPTTTASTFNVSSHLTTTAVVTDDIKPLETLNDFYFFNIDDFNSSFCLTLYEKSKSIIKSAEDFFIKDVRNFDNLLKEKMLLLNEKNLLFKEKSILFSKLKNIILEKNSFYLEKNKLLKEKTEQKSVLEKLIEVQKSKKTSLLKEKIEQKSVLEKLIEVQKSKKTSLLKEKISLLKEKPEQISVLEKLLEVEKNKNQFFINLINNQKMEAFLFLKEPELRLLEMDSSKLNFILNLQNKLINFEYSQFVDYISNLQKNLKKLSEIVYAFSFKNFTEENFVEVFTKLKHAIFELNFLDKNFIAAFDDLKKIDFYLNFPLGISTLNEFKQYDLFNSFTLQGLDVIEGIFSQLRKDFESFNSFRNFSQFLEHNFFVKFELWENEFSQLFKDFMYVWSFMRPGNDFLGQMDFSWVNFLARGKSFFSYFYDPWVQSAFIEAFCKGEPLYVFSEDFKLLYHTYNSFVQLVLFFLEKFPKYKEDFYALNLHERFQNLLSLTEELMDDFEDLQKFVSVYVVDSFRKFKDTLFFSDLFFSSFIEKNSVLFSQRGFSSLNFLFSNFLNFIIDNGFDLKSLFSNYISNNKFDLEKLFLKLEFFNNLFFKIVPDIFTFFRSSSLYFNFMFPDHFNFIESLFLFRINIMEHFLDFISFNYDKVGALNFFERNYIPDIISVFYNLDMDAESERICNFFSSYKFLFEDNCFTDFPLYRAETSEFLGKIGIFLVDDLETTNYLKFLLSLLLASEVNLVEKIDLESKFIDLFGDFFGINLKSWLIFEKLNYLRKSEEVAYSLGGFFDFADHFSVQESKIDVNSSSKGVYFLSDSDSDTINFLSAEGDIENFIDQDEASFYGLVEVSEEEEFNNSSKFREVFEEAVIEEEEDLSDKKQSSLYARLRDVKIVNEEENFFDKKEKNKEEFLMAVNLGSLPEVFEEKAEEDYSSLHEISEEEDYYQNFHEIFHETSEEEDDYSSSLHETSEEEEYYQNFYEISEEEDDYSSSLHETSEEEEYYQNFYETSEEMEEEYLSNFYETSEEMEEEYSSSSFQKIYEEEEAVFSNKTAFSFLELIDVSKDLAFNADFFNYADVDQFFYDLIDESFVDYKSFFDDLIDEIIDEYDVLSEFLNISSEVDFANMFFEPGEEFLKKNLDNFDLIDFFKSMAAFDLLEFIPNNRRGLFFLLQEKDKLEKFVKFFNYIKKLKSFDILEKNSAILEKKANDRLIIMDDFEKKSKVFLEKKKRNQNNNFVFNNNFLKSGNALLEKSFNFLIADPAQQQQQVFNNFETKLKLDATTAVDNVFVDVFESVELSLAIADRKNQLLIFSDKLKILSKKIVFYNKFIKFIQENFSREQIMSDNFVYSKKNPFWGKLFDKNFYAQLKSFDPLFFSKGSFAKINFYNYLLDSKNLFLKERNILKERILDYNNRNNFSELVLLSKSFSLSQGVSSFIESQKNLKIFLNSPNNDGFEYFLQKLFKEMFFKVPPSFDLKNSVALSLPAEARFFKEMQKDFNEFAQNFSIFIKAVDQLYYLENRFLAYSNYVLYEHGLDALLRNYMFFFNYFFILNNNIAQALNKWQQIIAIANKIKILIKTPNFTDGYHLLIMDQLKTLLLQFNTLYFDYQDAVKSVKLAYEKIHEILGLDIAKEFFDEEIFAKIRLGIGGFRTTFMNLYKYFFEEMLPIFAKSKASYNKILSYSAKFDFLKNLDPQFFDFLKNFEITLKNMQNYFALHKKCFFLFSRHKSFASDVHNDNLFFEFFSVLSPFVTTAKIYATHLFRFENDCKTLLDTNLLFLENLALIFNISIFVDLYNNHGLNLEDFSDVEELLTYIIFRKLYFNNVLKGANEANKLYINKLKNFVYINSFLPEDNAYLRNFLPKPQFSFILDLHAWAEHADNKRTADLNKNLPLSNDRTMVVYNKAFAEDKDLKSVENKLQMDLKKIVEDFAVAFSKLLSFFSRNYFIEKALKDAFGVSFFPSFDNYICEMRDLLAEAVSANKAQQKAAKETWLEIVKAVEEIASSFLSPNVKSIADLPWMQQVQLIMQVMDKVGIHYDLKKFFSCKSFEDLQNEFNGFFLLFKQIERLFLSDFLYRGVFSDMTEEYSLNELREMVSLSESTLKNIAEDHAKFWRKKLATIADSSSSVEPFDSSKFVDFFNEVTRKFEFRLLADWALVKYNKFPPFWIPSKYNPKEYTPVFWIPSTYFQKDNIFPTFWLPSMYKPKVKKVGFLKNLQRELLDHIPKILKYFLVQNIPKGYKNFLRNWNPEHINVLDYLRNNFDLFFFDKMTKSFFLNLDNYAEKNEEKKSHISFFFFKIFFKLFENNLKDNFWAKPVFLEVFPWLKQAEFLLDYKEIPLVTSKDLDSFTMFAQNYEIRDKSLMLFFERFIKSKVSFFEWEFRDFFIDFLLDFFEYNFFNFKWFFKEEDLIFYVSLFIDKFIDFDYFFADFSSWGGSDMTLYFKSKIDTLLSRPLFLISFLLTYLKKLHLINVAEFEELEEFEGLEVLEELLYLSQPLSFDLQKFQGLNAYLGLSFNLNDFLKISKFFENFFFFSNNIERLNFIHNHWLTFLTKFHEYLKLNLPLLALHIKRSKNSLNIFDDIFLSSFINKNIVDFDYIFINELPKLSFDKVQNFSFNYLNQYKKLLINYNSLINFTTFSKYDSFFFDDFLKKSSLMENSSLYSNLNINFFSKSYYKNWHHWFYSKFFLLWSTLWGLPYGYNNFVSLFILQGAFKMSFFFSNFFYKIFFFNFSYFLVNFWNVLNLEYFFNFSYFISFLKFPFTWHSVWKFIDATFGYYIWDDPYNRSKKFWENFFSFSFFDFFRSNSTIILNKRAQFVNFLQNSEKQEALELAKFVSLNIIEIEMLSEELSNLTVFWIDTMVKHLSLKKKSGIFEQLMSSLSYLSINDNFWLKPNLFAPMDEEEVLSDLSALRQGADDFTFKMLYFLDSMSSTNPNPLPLINDFTLWKFNLFSGEDFDVSFDDIFNFFAQFESDFSKFSRNLNFTTLFSKSQGLLKFKMENMYLLGNKSYILRVFKELQQEKLIILSFLKDIKSFNLNSSKDFNFYEDNLKVLQLEAINSLNEINDQLVKVLKILHYWEVRQQRDFFFKSLDNLSNIKDFLLKLQVDYDALNLKVAVPFGKEIKKMDADIDDYLRAIYMVKGELLENLKEFCLYLEFKQLQTELGIYFLKFLDFKVLFEQFKKFKFLYNLNNLNPEVKSFFFTYDCLFIEDKLAEVNSILLNLQETLALKDLSHTLSPRFLAKTKKQLIGFISLVNSFNFEELFNIVEHLKEFLLIKDNSFIDNLKNLNLFKHFYFFFDTLYLFFFFRFDLIYDKFYSFFDSFFFFDKFFFFFNKLLINFSSFFSFKFFSISYFDLFVNFFNYFFSIPFLFTSFNFEPFFFNFFTDYGTKYFLMRMDHLFLLTDNVFPFKFQSNFFEFSSLFSSLFSPFKFLNFLKLDYFLNFDKKLKQYSKIFFFVDYLLFPKKFRGLFLQNNKFFYNILFFQNNFFVNNSFFGLDFKNFLSTKVSYIFNNPFYNDCITFVFGNLNLRAQTLFDTNSIYLTNNMQFFYFLLSIFVERYINGNLDSVGEFFDFKTVFYYIDFFFFFFNNLSIDVFFSKLPKIFKTIIFNTFFGLNSFENFSFFFEISSFFDILLHAPNLPLSQIFDENFLSFLIDKRSENLFSRYFFFNSLNFMHFTRNQMLLLLKKFILDEFINLVVGDFYKENFSLALPLNFLKNLDLFSYYHMKPKSLNFLNYYNLKNYSFFDGVKSSFAKHSFFSQKFLDTALIERFNTFFKVNLPQNSNFFFPKFSFKIMSPFSFFRLFNTLHLNDFTDDDFFSKKMPSLETVFGSSFDSSLFSNIKFLFGEDFSFMEPLLSLKEFDPIFYNFDYIYRSMSGSVVKENYVKMHKFFMNKFFFSVNHNYFMQSSNFFFNKEFFFFNRSYSIFPIFSKMFSKYFIYVNPSLIEKPSIEQILVFFSKFPKNNYVLSKDLNGNIVAHVFGLSNFFDFTNLNLFSKFKFFFGSLDTKKNLKEEKNFLNSSNISLISDFFQDNLFFFGLFDTFNFSYKNFLNDFFFFKPKIRWHKNFSAFFDRHLLLDSYISFFDAFSFSNNKLLADNWLFFLNNQVNRTFLLKKKLFDYYSDFFKISQDNLIELPFSDRRLVSTKYQKLVDSFFFSFYKPFFDKNSFADSENFVSDIFVQAKDSLQKEKLNECAPELFTALNSDYILLKKFFKQLTDLEFLLKSLKKNYNSLDDNSFFIFNKMDLALSNISKLKNLLLKITKDTVYVTDDLLAHDYYLFDLVSGTYRLLRKFFITFLNLPKANFQFEGLSSLFKISSSNFSVTIQDLEDFINNFFLIESLFFPNREDIGLGIEWSFREFPFELDFFDKMLGLNFLKNFSGITRKFNNFSPKNPPADADFFFIIQNYFSNFGVINNDILQHNSDSLLNVNKFFINLQKDLVDKNLQNDLNFFFKISKFNFFYFTRRFFNQLFFTTNFDSSFFQRFFFFFNYYLTYNNNNSLVFKNNDSMEFKKPLFSLNLSLDSNFFFNFFYVNSWKFFFSNLDYAAHSFFHNFFSWLNPFYNSKIVDNFFNKKNDGVLLGYSNFYTQLSNFFNLKGFTMDKNLLNFYDLNSYIFPYFFDCLTYFFVSEKIFIMEVYLFIYYFFNKKFIMDFCYFFNFQSIEFILHYCFKFANVKSMELSEFFFLKSRFSFIWDFMRNLWLSQYSVNNNVNLLENDLVFNDVAFVFDIYSYLDVSPDFFDNYYFSFFLFKYFYFFDFFYLKIYFFDFFYNLFFY